ncbi:hypothetical protein FRB93_009353 [Tulasnella sp. JGI-2019a]|nr:hypothetical protein FRB93_009353 [Tulasnella sp. JGI-2019a]
MSINLYLIPVETLADIFSLLSIPEIVVVSRVSRHLRLICQDPLLNPWRRPIIRLLRSDQSLDALKTLSVHSVVPRQNFVEILCLASPHFILLGATLPHLTIDQWHEVLNRRFLPSWGIGRHTTNPREQYMRTLWSIWHRLNSSCNTQAWCSYVVIGRNGIVHSNAAYTRSYEPLVVFEDLKVQADLAHLPTQVRVLLQLEDVRILALGTLHRRTSFWVNPWARLVMHPPGVEVSGYKETKQEQLLEREVDEINTPDPEEAAELGEGTADMLSELQPTLSRESANSITRRNATSRFFSRERSWSGSPLRRTSLSLFRTHSLDVEEEHEPVAGPSNGSVGRSLMRLLTRSGREPVSPQSVTSQSDGSPVDDTSTLPSSVSPTAPNFMDMMAKSKGVPTLTEGDGRSSKLAPYPVLQHPRPAPEFANYPNFTPGGADSRWIGQGEMEEDGLLWAGPLMLTAQITGPRPPGFTESLGDSLLSQGKFVPFNVHDLNAIAPWVAERWTKVNYGDGGPVLGS